MKKDEIIGIWLLALTFLVLGLNLLVDLRSLHRDNEILDKVLTLQKATIFLMERK